MRQKRLIWLIIPTLIALFMGLAVAQASATEITVSAAPGEVAAGDEFTITVDVSGVTDLFAASLDLTYNPGQLDVVAVHNGSIIPADDADPETEGVQTLADMNITNWVDRDNGDGTRTFSHWQTRLGDVAGVNGDGTLLSLVLVAKQPGPLSLSFGGPGSGAVGVINLVSAAGELPGEIPFSMSGSPLALDVSQRQAYIVFQGSVLATGANQDIDPIYYNGVPYYFFNQLTDIAAHAIQAVGFPSLEGLSVEDLAQLTLSGAGLMLDVDESAKLNETEWIEVWKKTDDPGSHATVSWDDGVNQTPALTAASLTLDSRSSIDAAGQHFDEFKGHGILDGVAGDPLFQEFQQIFGTNKYRLYYLPTPEFPDVPLGIDQDPLVLEDPYEFDFTVLLTGEYPHPGPPLVNIIPGEVTHGELPISLEADLTGVSVPNPADVRAMVLIDNGEGQDPEPYIPSGGTEPIIVPATDPDGDDVYEVSIAAQLPVGPYVLALFDGDPIPGVMPLAAGFFSVVEAQAVDTQVAIITPPAVDRDVDIAVTRPLQITAEAGENVTWTVTIASASGFPGWPDLVVSQDFIGPVLNVTWPVAQDPDDPDAPWNNVLPLGNWNITVSAVDDAGNGVSWDPIPVSVYNYPIKIKQVTILNGMGQPQSVFQPGKTYQISVQYENLDAAEQPVLVLAKVERETTGAPVTEFIGFSQDPIAGNSVATRGVGTNLPADLDASQPITYKVSIMVWSSWLSLGGQPVAVSETVTFTVEE